jgi:transposase
VGRAAVIQLTPQMRILVAVEAQDFRKGIDGLARVCREVLGADPFSGCVFVFRNRRQTALRLLCYDGQGYWLAHKRLSRGRFRWWPASASTTAALAAHQVQRLLVGGDPTAADAAPVWRRFPSA